MLAKIDRLKNWQVSGVFIIVGFAAFFTGLKNQFLGDDGPQIVDNPVVHSITHIWLLFEGGTFYKGSGIAPLSGSYYRPLMSSVFSLLYTLFGPHPFYFHLLQLLLCISSSYLLYLLFHYSFSTVLSLFLALIFLVHPLNSQAVFEISTMQDVLFFFFGILSLWILVRYSSIRSLLLVAVCLLLSILSKETGLLFVVMALLYLFWWNRKRLYSFIGIMVLPTALYMLLRINAIGIFAKPNSGPIDSLSLTGRLLTAPSIQLLYITKLIFPWKLASAYYWVDPIFSIRHFLLPLIIDVAVASMLVHIAFMIKKRSNKAMFYTYLFFLIWCSLGSLTYLQIVPLDFTATDSWYYFTMAGVLGMLGVVVKEFYHGKYIQPRILLLIAVLAVAVLAVLSALRGLDWKSSYSLAKKDIAASSDEYTAYNDLAQYYINSGNYTHAIQDAKHSVNIYPTYVNNNNLGLALADSGNYSGAYTAYNNGLKYGNEITLYENIGALTLIYGSPAGDQQFLVTALDEYPDDSNLWLYLAVLEYKYGNNNDAKIAINRAAMFGQVPANIYNSIISDKKFTIVFGHSVIDE